MLTVELVITIIVEFVVGMAITALANAERKQLQILRKFLLVVFAVVGIGLIVLVFFGPKPFYDLFGVVTGDLFG